MANSTPMTEDQYRAWFKKQNGVDPTPAQYQLYLKLQSDPVQPASPNPGALIPDGAGPGPQPHANDQVPGMDGSQLTMSDSDIAKAGDGTPGWLTFAKNLLKVGIPVATAFLAYKSQQSANAAQGQSNAALDQLAGIAQQEQDQSNARFADASKLRGPATNSLLAKLNAGVRATPDVNRFEDTSNPFRAKFGTVAHAATDAPNSGTPPIPPPSIVPPPPVPPPNTGGPFTQAVETALNNRPTPTPATTPVPPAVASTPAPSNGAPPSIVPPPPIQIPAFLRRIKAKLGQPLQGVQVPG